MSAPTSGATQNIHSCAVAQSSMNSAWPVERAGFTDVFVIDIEIRRMRVRDRPMASGAKPAGASLSMAPRMIIRKKKVRTISAMSAAIME